MTAADLTLVGVAEDGRHLLLRDRAGTQYQLLLDAALRSAVRHEHTRPQTSERPQMSPREVQTLIRAGASADEVAEMSGWSPEKIAKYEGPVLAEREFVASLATQVRLHSMTGSTLLSTRVAERLAVREVDPESASWDAWRAAGRPWTLQLAFPAGGRLREARWTFDVQTRTVTPEDDEARWLSADSDSRPAPFVPLSNQGDDTSSGYGAPAAYEPWDADVHAPAAMSLEEAVEAVAPLQVEDAPRPTDDELEESLRRRSKGRRGLLHRAPRAGEPSSAAVDDASPQGAGHPSPAPAAQQPQDAPEDAQDASVSAEGDAPAEPGDEAQHEPTGADGRDEDESVNVVPGTLATAVGGEELVEAVADEQDDDADDDADDKTDLEPDSDDADTHETHEARASDAGRPGPASLTAGSTGSVGALEATPDVATPEPAPAGGERAAASEATPIEAAAPAIALPAAPAAPQVKEIDGEEDVPAQAASPAQSAPAAPQDETTEVVTEVDAQEQEQAVPRQPRRTGQRQQPRKGARNQRPTPAVDAPAPAPEQPQRSRRQPAPKKKSSRASVPSWDDIMFGSKKD